MISFDGLNIVVGALAAFGAYAVIKYRLKRTFSLAVLSSIIVATFLVSFYLSSIMFYGLYLDWYIKSEINQNPLMAMVEKYYPKDYKMLIKNAENGFKTKEEKDKIIAQSYELSNRIFILSLRNAPEDEINAYVITTLELYAQMIKQDPNFIIKFEHGDPALALDFNYLMKEVKLNKYLKRALNARKEIIKNSITDPIQTIDPKRGLEIIQSIMTHLTDKYGGEAVTYAFSETQNNLPPEIKARVILSFFQELAKLDVKNRVLVVRYIGIMTAQEILKKPE